jgi:hypothetical protein
MSNWTARFLAHPIRDALRDAVAVMGPARARVGSAEDGASLERISQILSEVSRRLDSTDPNLVHLPALDTISGHVANLTVSLRQFAQDGDTNTLAQASGHGDSIVAYMTAIIVPQNSDDVAAIGEAIVSFRRSVGQHTRNVGDQLEQLRSGIEGARQIARDVTSDLTQQKTRIDTFISQAEQRIATAESDRATRFTATEQAHNDQVLSALRQFTEQHSAAQQLRTDAFAIALADVRAANETLISEIQASAQRRDEASTELLDDFRIELEAQKAALVELRSAADAAAVAQRGIFETEAKNLIAVLEERKREAADLVGIIANTGMAGSHQQTANVAAKKAERWSLVATASLVGVILFTLYAFLFRHPSGDFSWTELASKLSVIAGFILLFAFARSKSQRYGDVEQQHRTRQIHFESVNPYLASLPPDRQHALKEQLAATFFRSETPTMPTPPEKFPVPAIDAAREAVALATELVKQK